MRKRPLPGDSAYRALQQHLDRLPIGFPASKTGADIALLKHIFTPDQARIAACLSHIPQSAEMILEKTEALGIPKPVLEKELTAMVKKGGLEIRLVKGQKQYANTPLVVGMYELQLNRLTPEFIRDFKAYTGEKPFGISFLSPSRSQMRTIPIGKSITPALVVEDFDRISTLLDRARPPFVILPCICRKKKAIQNQPCEKTDRVETCLALGHIGETVLEMGMGREITREEAGTIIELNQKEGLVLQPANTREVEFICSCCGCCCSMLSLQKELPLPLDFWTTGFRAALDRDSCIGCGRCITQCQTNALTIKIPADKYPDKGNSKRKIRPELNPGRCIGCGLCIPSCPVHAIELKGVRKKGRPPRDRDEYNRKVLNENSGIRKIITLGKLAKGMAVTGDFSLLKSSPEKGD